MRAAALSARPAKVGSGTRHRGAIDAACDQPAPTAPSTPAAPPARHPATRHHRSNSARPNSQGRARVAVKPTGGLRGNLADSYSATPRTMKSSVLVPLALVAVLCLGLLPSRTSGFTICLVQNPGAWGRGRAVAAAVAVHSVSLGAPGGRRNCRLSRTDLQILLMAPDARRLRRGGLKPAAFAVMGLRCRGARRRSGLGMGRGLSPWPPTSPPGRSARPMRPRQRLRVRFIACSCT
jgi:hypothetical protein